MLLNVAPVDYERNLALYGASLMVVPPHGDATPPKREVDEPDAVAARSRQPPPYEKKFRPDALTHPIVTRRGKAERAPDNAVHQQPPPSLAGALRLQEQSEGPSPQRSGILPRQIAGLYRPHPEPPLVGIELTA